MLKLVYIVGFGYLTIIIKEEYYREDWEYIGDDDRTGYTVVYSPCINAYCIVKLSEEV